MENRYPIYELTLGDAEDTGCFAISLVDAPAVESNFLMFSEDKDIEMFSISSDEKRLVSGIAMRADHPILRIDPYGNKYYIVFSKDTVRKMAERFHKEQLEFNINLQHEIPVDGCYVVESYIIDKGRNICPAEFSDIEDGSWYVTVKIDNDEVWDLLKTTDALHGFSIEVAMEKAAMAKMSKSKPASILDTIIKGKF